MATLSLKTKPEIVPGEIKLRRQKALDFSRAKPVAAPLLQFQPKKHVPGTPTYAEVFGTFKPYRRTTGEDMLIIRAAMHKQGMPEIPEHFTIPQFASAMQWHILGRTKRHAWQHFMGFEIVEARRYIAAWADKLLPVVASDETEAPAKFSSLGMQMIKAVA